MTEASKYREHLARLRYQSLQRLRESVAKRTLADMDWLIVGRILDYINAGFDPRKEFGIKPARGQRPKVGRNRWIALHYWDLRLRGNMTDEKAREQVSNVWRMSMERVYQIALPLRDWCEDFLPATSSEQIAETAAVLSTSK